MTDATNETPTHRPGFDRNGVPLFKAKGCGHCDLLFHPANSGDKFCSEECKRLARNVKIREKRLKVAAEEVETSEADQDDDRRVRLLAQWSNNLAELPPVERQILQEKAKIVIELTAILNDKKLQPTAFRRIQKFIRESGGTTREWMPSGQESEFPEAIQKQDDSFRLYGLSTRIWCMFWEQWLKRILTHAGAIGLKPKEITYVEEWLLAEIQAEYDRYEDEREKLNARWPKNVWNEVTKLYEPENGAAVVFKGLTDEQIDAIAEAAKTEPEIVLPPPQPDDAPYIRPQPKPQIVEQIPIAPSKPEPRPSFLRPAVTTEEM